MKTEAPFKMANLFPKHTGLPFVVWISVRRRKKISVPFQIKVSASGKAMPRDATEEEFGLLQGWIELNRATLIAYWDGDIDTQDALEALKKEAK